MPLWYHRVDDYKWIHGSIRQDLEPDERSVWGDFLALAGLTREPRRGYIERSEGIPYPKKVLVCMLNISDELFDRTVDKCVKEGRLTLYPDGTMYITNWSRYNEVESWHARKKREEEKKEARNIAIEKAKKTRSTNDTVAVANMRLTNKLNGIVNELDKKVNGKSEN